MSVWGAFKKILEDTRRENLEKTFIRDTKFRQVLLQSIALETGRKAFPDRATVGSSVVRRT